MVCGGGEVQSLCLLFGFVLLLVQVCGDVSIGVSDSIPYSDWDKIDSSAIATDAQGNNLNTDSMDVMSAASSLLVRASALSANNPKIAQALQLAEVEVSVMTLGDQTGGKTALGSAITGQTISFQKHGVATRSTVHNLVLPNCYDGQTHAEPKVVLQHPQLNAMFPNQDFNMAISVDEAAHYEPVLMEHLGKQNLFSRDPLRKTFYICNNSQLALHQIDTIGIQAPSTQVEGSGNFRAIVDINTELIRKHIIGSKNLLLILNPLGQDVEKLNYFEVLNNVPQLMEPNREYSVLIVFSFPNVDLPALLKEDSQFKSKLDHVKSYEQLYHHFCDNVMNLIKRKYNYDAQVPCIFAPASSIDSTQFMEAKSRTSFQTAVAAVHANRQENEKILMDVLLAMKTRPGFIEDAKYENQFFANYVGVAPITTLIRRTQLSRFHEMSNRIVKGLSTAIQQLEHRRNQLRPIANKKVQLGRLVVDFAIEFSRVFYWMVSGSDTQDVIDDEVFDIRGQVKDEYFGTWMEKNPTTLEEDLTLVNSTHLSRDNIPSSFPYTILLDVGKPAAVNVTLDQHLLDLMPKNMRARKASSLSARLKRMKEYMIAQFISSKVESMSKEYLLQVLSVAGFSNGFNLEAGVFSRLTKAVLAYGDHLSSYIAHVYAVLIHDTAQRAFRYLSLYRPALEPFVLDAERDIGEVMQTMYYELEFDQLFRKLRVWMAESASAMDHLMPTMFESLISFMPYYPETVRGWIEEHAGAEYVHIYRQVLDSSDCDFSKLRSPSASPHHESNPLNGSMEVDDRTRADDTTLEQAKHGFVLLQHCAPRYDTDTIVRYIMAHSGANLNADAIHTPPKNSDIRERDAQFVNSAVERITYAKAFMNMMRIDNTLTAKGPKILLKKHSGGDAMQVHEWCKRLLEKFILTVIHNDDMIEQIQQLRLALGDVNVKRLREAGFRMEIDSDNVDNETQELFETLQQVRDLEFDQLKVRLRDGVYDNKLKDAIQLSARYQLAKDALKKVEKDLVALKAFRHEVTKVVDRSRKSQQ